VLALAPPLASAVGHDGMLRYPSDLTDQEWSLMTYREPYHSRWLDHARRLGAGQHRRALVE
jgi:hypothetical protein